MPEAKKKKPIKFPVALTPEQYSFVERYVNKLRENRRGWSKAALIRVAIEVLRLVRLDPGRAMTERDLVNRYSQRLETRRKQRRT